MNRCPTCAPGIRCLACTLDADASFSLTYEDEEADTPVARRRDARREDAEARAPTRVRRPE